MLNFYDEYYKELAEEIREQTQGRSGTIYGAVELQFGGHEVIFGFDYNERIHRWLVLTFEGGYRCSSDFEIKKLEQWL